MQNLSSSKYDNVIENAISNLQNINNIQESNFKLMESNISNNFSQSNIQGNQDGMKENSFDNESFSILNSVYLPNESEINNSNFNESKYDDIFNSKISNLNICNNIQENKIPNQSIILKNEFQEFELFNPKKISKEEFIIPTDWEYSKDNAIFEIEKKIQKISNKINKK